MINSAIYDTWRFVGIFQVIGFGAIFFPDICLRLLFRKYMRLPRVLRWGAASIVFLCGIYLAFVSTQELFKLEYQEYFYQDVFMTTLMVILGFAGRYLMTKSESLKKVLKDLDE